jgi:hypothetical protein
MNVRAVSVVSPWLSTAAHVSHSHAGQMHYWQAIILGVLQGVSELFPVSSLGHTVVFPALFGWHNVVAAQSASTSARRLVSSCTSARTG